MIEVEVLARVYHRRAQHGHGVSCVRCRRSAATVAAEYSELLEWIRNSPTPEATQAPLAGIALEEIVARIGSRRDGMAPRCFP